MLHVLVCEPADYFLHAFGEKIAAHPEYKVELASEIVSLDPFIFRGPDVLSLDPFVLSPSTTEKKLDVLPDVALIDGMSRAGIAGDRIVARLASERVTACVGISCNKNENDALRAAGATDTGCKQQVFASLFFDDVVGKVFNNFHHGAVQADSVAGLCASAQIGLKTNKVKAAEVSAALKAALKAHS